MDCMWTMLFQLKARQAMSLFRLLLAYKLPLATRGTGSERNILWPPSLLCCIQNSVLPNPQIPAGAGTLF